MAAGKRLKVFRLHSGFYDMIIAAPSQKAALAAWGARPNEFSHGFAAVTDDAQAVKAALAQPGTVLKRQFGSKDPFLTEQPALRGPKIWQANKTKAAEAERKKKQAELAAKRKKEQEAIRRANEERKNRLRELDEREAQIRKERLALEKSLKPAPKKRR